MIQQNITYIVDGYSPIGPNGEFCRKETTAVQTLDGLIQALRYLHTVQQYKCLTVSTKLVSVQEAFGGVHELEQTPEGITEEVQT